MEYKPREKHQPKNCSICNTPFIPYHLRWSKFCSKKCRLKEGYERVARGLRVIAKESSEERNLGATWKYNFPLPLCSRLLTITIPYTIHLSKNKGWRINKYGNTYVARETKDARETIIWRIKAKKINWVEAKTYLSLFIQRPQWQGDPINMIDQIADAVKVGIGVDDRWFAIDRVDWIVARNDPKIIITIWQSDDERQRGCIYCARTLTADKFPGKKENRNKRNHYDAKVCSECMSLARIKGNEATIR